MRISFMRTPRHRKFHHAPIYYDKAKEERAERERKIREELGIISEEDKKRGPGERIRGKMRQRIKSGFEVNRSEKKKSNIRLIIILMALMILFYYLLNVGYEWYSTLLQ
ncbi:hypothetical protein QA597_03855 [Marinilabiliaceae bacterium ANBcel2]|nr:hypothetical protein [Marinilabiliaceae bacterium ANBcel2]